MVQDADLPLFPTDFHTLLATYCIYEEMVTYKKQLDTAQELWVRTIEPQETNLLDFVVNHESLIIVPDDGRGMRETGSNLGSWFPAGRW
jgi:hypothetical protein